METDAETDVTDSQMMQVEEPMEDMDAETDVTDSQMMQVEEPMEDMDWGQDENINYLLCQALDEEMERQRRLDMYGGGAAPPHAHPQAPPPAQAPPAPPHAQAPPAQAPPAQAPAQQPPVQQAALNDTARRVTFHPVNQLDILQSMNELEYEVTDLLKQEMERHQGIKWHMELTAEYYKMNQDGERIATEQIFRSDTTIAVNDNDLTNTLTTAMQEIYRRSQEFQAEGSGWTLDRVMSLTVHTVYYQPLLGNSYIKLPEYVKSKKAVLNIQNDDDKCILWSILAHLHPIARENHPYRVNKYQPYETELNMAGVSYPTPLADILKIENNNNISINVIGYDSTDHFYPLRVTRNIREQHVNLLLIKEGEKKPLLPHQKL